jgi:hypothetical protein
VASKLKSALFTALAVAMTACSGSSASHGSATAASSPGNPIAFPIYDGANVLSSHEWHRTVVKQSGAADRAIYSEGAGTYDGHDVVAGTQAMMPVLEAWLGDLVAHPPEGYSVAVTGNTIDSVRTHTRELGFDFEAFTNTQNGRRHGVVVMAVDPQLLDEKAGPMLGLISRFKNMPPMWRDPIDVQVKRQTGFSLSDATNPDTPIGAAIAALGQLRDFGGRGIVLIDAAKQ